MIEIQNKIIADEIIEEEFVCDLDKCKGGCCVDGDTGAPITEEEAKVIYDLYSEIKEYLSPQGIQLIENEGTHAHDEDFGLVTPTIEGGLCAYGYYDEKGIVKCAFEKHYLVGKSNFKKPISCHLFPIRITEANEFDLLNYEPRKKLCAPACKLGKKLKVPVYKFLKEALIRKYGEQFYEDLDATAEYLKNKE